MSLRHAAIPVVAFLIAVGALQPSHGKEIGRWSGQHAAVTARRTIVATTSDDWQSLLALTGDATLEGKPFDTAHQTGIGIFLGRRNSGGYAVKIVSMSARDGKFVVQTDEQKPGADQMTTQSLTSPWVVLLIDRPALPVSIEPRVHP